MTWKSFHHRGEILRTVIATADIRGDGTLPMDVEGVTDTFGDELTLLGALQLRWHTRLAGKIEGELMHQPLDLEAAVIAAWHATAEELPGVRAILDHYRAEPLDVAMSDAMVRSAAKDHVLLAFMAGQASVQDASAARVGARLEAKARTTDRPATKFMVALDGLSPHSLLDRLKAALAA